MLRPDCYVYLLFFLPFTSLGQVATNLAESLAQVEQLRRDQQYEAAIQVAEQVLADPEAVISADPAIAVQFYLAWGRSYIPTSECPAAEEPLKQALKIYHQQVIEAPKVLYLIHRSLGQLYERIYMPELALDHYQQALTPALSAYGEAHSRVGILYGNMAFRYLDLGDFSNTDLYLQRYLRLLKKTLESDSDQLLQCLYKSGAVYWRMGRLDSAIRYLELAELLVHDEKGRKLNATDLELINALGSVNWELGREKKASYYYQLALDLEDKPNPVPLLRSDWERQLARHARVDMQYFFSELERRRVQLNPQHPGVASCHAYIGLAHQRQGAFRQSLQFYQRALMMLAPNLTDSAITANPQQLENVSHPMLLLDAMMGKTDTWHAWYAATDSAALLTQAFASALATSRVVDMIRKGYKPDPTQHFWSEKIRPFYDRALATAYSLYKGSQDPLYVRAAFALAEKSKAFLLLQALKNQQAADYAGLPPELLAAETALRDSMHQLDRNLLLEAQKGSQANSDRLNLWRHQMERQALAYEALIKRWERDFPAYYNLKYNPEVLDLADLQAYLKAQSPPMGLLEYAWTSDQVFGFFISADTVLFRRLGSGDSLQRIIQAFRDLGTDLAYLREAPQAARQDYARLAWSLYQQLLLPHSAELMMLPQPRRLLIVSDRSLSYLPFELLLTEAPDQGHHSYQLMPFMLRSFAISYAHSGTHIVRHSPPRKSSLWRGLRYAGFAPGASQSTMSMTSRGPSLARLKFHQQEVSAAAARFDGKAFLTDEADEARFRAEAPLADILHLATHAMLPDTHVYQAHFWMGPQTTDADNRLYLNELYQLQITASLAVLSACETGYGPYRQGEGVMSLARAFSFAGCPSIVMSLWQIDDVSSAQLMNTFWDQVAKGQAMDLALRDAKLIYLNSAEPAFSHPYFWGAFTLIGRAEPLPQPSPWRRVVLIALISLTLIGVGVGIRYYRRSRSAAARD